MPQIIRVEDFAPYWVLDRWTPERMLEDLKIMRAIGSSCIRIHITPPAPGATAYDRLGNRRTVPITGEKYLAMYDLMVKAAHDLDMAIHFDIGSSFSEVSETSLDGWMNRYRGIVESYQFANENYGLFESDRAEGSEASFARLDRLLRHARGLDPAARYTMDIFPPEIAHIRAHYPEAYESLSVLNSHPYHAADHRGWTDPWLRNLVEIHSQGMPPSPDLPWEPESIMVQKFAGIADFGKEIWITETAATGDGVWSSLVPDEVEASGWFKAVDAFAHCDQVTRLYWCWFTDKLHSVEAGVTQAGAVRYDGSPLPLTHAFRETAEAHAPADSLIRRLRIDVESVTIDRAATTAPVTIRLHNRSQTHLSGQARLELPAGLTADDHPFAFDLGPGQTMERSLTLQIGALPETANHIFLRVEAAGQVHYGWGVVNAPRPLVLAGEEAGLPGASYLPNRTAVQDFLTRYGDDCAIVIGPGSGHGDVEMGYRLKIILESLRGHEVPLKTWFMLPEVWDRPLIIVGRPVFNYCAQLIELALSPAQRAEAQAPGAGFVQWIERPLGSAIGSWGPDPRGKLVGFHKCPAALYIAGGDDAGTQVATYDLIKRLWHPAGTSGPKAHWL
jgi:hypothetical protein